MRFAAEADPRDALHDTSYSIVPGAGERWSSAPASATRPSSFHAIVALTDRERAEIDAMYASLTTGSLYAILGAPRHADGALLDAMRDALLAAFGPDRFAHRRLAGQLRKLEIIVACVTEAHATLRDPVRRAAYDRRIAGGARR